MKNTIPFLYFLLFLISSCSQSPEKTDKSSPETQEIPAYENFSSGVVIDNIPLKADPTQGYSLYLPKSYDKNKSYPVIYAFDPHKAGKLPVSKYAELAEKYNYIIIGSNNSENGIPWEQSEATANKIFSDSKSRININPGRVYLMGFSGGARIANALTIKDNSISGVICCGASAPAANVVNPRDNYTFMGIAGDGDFNYSEMLKYDMLDLAGRRLKHTLLLFEGKHEWPPVEIMEEAFLWSELNFMRKDPSSKNEALVKKNITTEKNKLDELLKQNKNYEAYELSRKVINYYEQLDELKPFFDCYNKLKGNPEIDKQLKQNEADWTSEEKQKQEYINNLQTKELSWWQKEVASLNAQIKGKKDKNSGVKKRILSYLSLVCYMQTNAALKQNNIKAAEHFGKLYILVDPENKEAHYLMAVISASGKNPQAAIKSMEAAIKNGFNEKQRIETEAAFSSIRNTKEFKKAVEKIN
jgi:dienelactone hydrolase